MRAEGTFTVESTQPAAVSPEPTIETELPVVVLTMEKRFEGDVVGRSATVFTGAFDPKAGVGTYIAMESFEGALNGASGAFNFVHAASTSGADRIEELFLIVPNSGTRDLKGIAGRGSMTVDGDGTHRLWFEYELA